MTHADYFERKASYQHYENVILYAHKFSIESPVK